MFIQRVCTVGISEANKKRALLQSGSYSLLTKTVFTKQC